jgi:hypothetical protein
VETLPLTGLSQTLDCIFLLIAWALVGGRIRRTNGPVTDTVRYMYRYFGYFALFNLLMALPHLVLFWQPWLFPPAMAWGYIGGNIFLLVALSYLSRLTVKVMPQFARFDGWVLGIWIGLNAVMTALNIWVIGLRHQPTYDIVTHVTHYDIPGWMGGMLGMISLAAYLPVIVVFVVTAIKQADMQRGRSVLLAIGMALIMIVGPLHAVAGSWQVFLTADVLNVVSLIFLATGIMYRFNQTNAARVTSPVVSAATNH